MKKNKKSNQKKSYKNISIIICIMIILGIGILIYAHASGSETIISPLLRNLGINGKHEENTSNIDDNNDITIKLLDGTIDDNLLIIGSNINIPDMQAQWIEINGVYLINDLQVNPTNTMINKISNTEFIYYQAFDINKIDIKDTQNIKFNINISEIKEVNELENEDIISIKYGRSYIDGWNSEENITIKNIEDKKTYEFKNPETYETNDHINVSATEFITNSINNNLKIEVNKTDYTGNDFKKYYKILDEQKNKIATFEEGEKEYDHRIDNDSLLLNNINNNSKIFIVVYLKEIDNDDFNKVLEIPVNLSDTIEREEQTANLKEYKNDDYTMKYKDNWNLIQEVDTTRVGPNSSYLGALELEIPSTTNSEYTSSIYVKVTNENTTTEDLENKIKKDNSNEHFEEILSSELNLKNQKANTIITKTTDGEGNYIKQDIFTAVNGKSYIITFFGSESEYNNLKNDISEFIENFEI